MKGVILVNEFFNEPQPARMIALERLCGVSLLERHVRNLRQCGARAITVVVPSEWNFEPDVAERIGALGYPVEIVEESKAKLGLDEQEDLLIVAGDYFIEKRLIEHLVKESRPAFLVDHESMPDAESHGHYVSVGCARVYGETLISLLRKGTYQWRDIFHSLSSDKSISQLDGEAIPSYHHSIRRHRPSKWIRIKEEADLDLVQQWIIDSAQKGSLDLPAQVLHAPIENHIVSRLCETSITPNQLTLITNITAWLVTWGILSGFIWPALIGAALVGIMDGVDGKLARVKIMTSKIGKLEHAFDMVFEYSWWLSLGWVLGHANPNSPAFEAGIGLIILSFTDMLIGVVFWFMLGRTHNRTIDNYTPFELSVRKISGRRNIYIWLLLLCGPFIGLEAALWVCVWWGIVTIFVRGGRALWLLGTRQSPMDIVF
ncbi:MAG: hypothetical protein QNI91_03385 [Arenicellales bacterium]|nr:hypothetical protein [Arenicellales bacterium]